MVGDKIYYYLNLNWGLKGNVELFPFPCEFGLYFTFLKLKNTCRRFK